MLRLPRFQVALAGVAQRGPPGGSTRITSAPVVGQQHRRQRPRDVLPEVDHAHAASGPATACLLAADTPASAALV